MSLCHHGFYTMDEQMMHMKGIGPFIYVSEGTWASGCCWRLLTCRQVAQVLWGWGGSRAAWLAFGDTGKTALTAGV